MYPAIACFRYERLTTVRIAIDTSTGSARNHELANRATSVSATMTPDITRCGNAHRTAELILLTSDVMRVSRSPDDACSTWPSGRRSTIRTTASRAEASMP